MGRLLWLFWLNGVCVSVVVKANGVDGPFAFVFVFVSFILFVLILFVLFVVVVQYVALNCGVHFFVSF